MLAPARAHAEGRILVLSQDDETAYRKAFTASERGDWDEAYEALAQVTDGTLAGDVLAKRYLSASYSATYDELAEWMKLNADSPRAADIYALARTKRTPGDAPLTPPTAGARRSMPFAGSTPPGDSAAARAQIETAAQQMANGDLANALLTAQAAASGPRQGPAEFQIGLIYFRTENFAEAALHFDVAANWRYWDGAGAAGANYWAGRAHLAAGEAKAALVRFKTALAYPATFYGQMAEAQLGRDSGLEFSAPTITAEDALGFMTRYSQARRAAALAQVGRLSDVEQELRALHGRIAPAQDRLFLDFADALSAPSAQLRAAEFGGRREAWGYCPTTDFAPQGGWRLDRATVLAVARQESRYSPIAMSRSNARGLMQLLASTAADIDPSVRGRPERLFEPGYNLRLGQTYLEWLMRQAAPDGDLVKLFAAYNGGPGWLTRWLATQPDLKDPLMMMEMLPRAESRDYAERVVANVGLCRKRFGQEASEFDELASGQAARYVHMDK
jgi:soluble lytic murein transglycosylase-like protein